jgi:hypothetical protein
MPDKVGCNGERLGPCLTDARLTVHLYIGNSSRPNQKKSVLSLLVPYSARFTIAAPQQNQCSWAEWLGSIRMPGLIPRVDHKLIPLPAALALPIFPHPSGCKRWDEPT